MWTEPQFLDQPIYKLLPALNTKIPTLYVFSLASYYCNSTFLSKLDDRKFRDREKKKEIKYHILQQVHDISIHYKPHTLEVSLGCQPCQDETDFCPTLYQSPPSGAYVASHKLSMTEATHCQKRLHSMHLLWDGQWLTHTISDKAMMQYIPRGTSFLFLPEPRLLSSSSSVLKTSFKSNFFFCFPGGGGGAAAAAFGVLGCCCAGEFQIFTTASTHSTYFNSIWTEATLQNHTLQIYADR